MSGGGRFHTDVLTLTLTGSGESREQALNQVLARMRREVPQRVKGPILFMAPVDVAVTRLEVTPYTEKFLWLFWPRTRHRYELEVRLSVEVRWLEFPVSPGEEVNHGGA